MIWLATHDKQNPLVWYEPTWYWGVCFTAIAVATNNALFLLIAVMPMAIFWVIIGALLIKEHLGGRNGT